MTIDIERLRADAKAATPGPWRIQENARHNPEWCDLTICGDGWQLADINGPQYDHQVANARHIANMDPPTTLVIIDAIDAANARAGKAEAEVRRLRQALEQAAEWFDECAWVYVNKGKAQKARRIHLKAEYCRAALQKKLDAG